MNNIQNTNDSGFNQVIYILVLITIFKFSQEDSNVKLKIFKIKIKFIMKNKMHF